MIVKELITKLSKQDQNSIVFMELELHTENCRTVISQLINSISCRAGGSLDKEDNQYYGVILRSVSR
jgi:hypothetical protein